MRKMKDSGIAWVGKIPAEWKIYRMKNCIIDRTSGSWGNEAANNDGDSICLRIADFDYSRFRFKNVPLEQLTIRNYDYETIKKLALIKGDILIEKSGGGEKTPVGRTVIFDKDFSALYANFMDRLRCASSLVTSEWMQYIFVTFYKNGYSKNYIKQTTGIQNLDLTTMLANENIPVPSIHEQETIVAFLDEKCANIDAVIEKTHASIDEYKKLKQAVITRAVTKGIRQGRKMKDSGIEWIGEIPAEWDCTLLKRHCNFQTGSTPSTANEQWFNGGLDWFTPADFGDSYYLSDSCRKLSLQAKKDGVATMIPSSTVMIIGIGGTAGKIGITMYECSCNQQITAMITDEFLYPKYLMYWMVANTKRLKDTALYTTLPILNNQTIGEYALLVPASVDEQQEIAYYLDAKTAAIDRLIAKKEQLIAEMESCKKSLIYEVVTGKREVPA